MNFYKIQEVDVQNITAFLIDLQKQDLSMRGSTHMQLNNIVMFLRGLKIEQKEHKVEEKQEEKK